MSPTPPLAYITGASSGIGQALAARYLQAGWRVVLVARRADALRAWADAQGAAAARVSVLAADVADIASITAAGRECLAQQGVPDVVIANAGFSTGVDTSLEEDLAVVARLYAVNNVGLAATFQPFLRPMWAQRRGTLVGIASVTGIRGLPGHGGYCASKAAVISYCESLRGECRPHGVRVVTLLPGYVDTPLTRHDPYHKPFMLSAEAFADRAFHAISAGTSYRVIPWQMAVVAKALRVLPNAWFDRVMDGRPRKPRGG